MKTDRWQGGPFHCMIDMADCVITYVVHNFGGAFNSLSYAQRRYKQVIYNLIELQLKYSCTRFPGRNRLTLGWAVRSRMSAGNRDSQVRPKEIGRAHV